MKTISTGPDRRSQGAVAGRSALTPPPPSPDFWAFMAETRAAAAAGRPLFGTADDEDSGFGPHDVPAVDGFSSCSRCGAERSAVVLLTRNLCALCHGAPVPHEPAYADREGRPGRWAAEMRRRATDAPEPVSLDLGRLAAEYNRRAMAPRPRTAPKDGATGSGSRRKARTGLNGGRPPSSPDPISPSSTI